MSKPIQQILEDLYLIDPTLKEKEKDLINVITVLLESKPQMEIDQAFVKRLREELIPQKTKKNFMKFPFMSRLNYAIGGGIIALVIAIPLVNYFQTFGGDSSINTEDLFTTISSNGFGALYFDTSDGESLSGRDAVAATEELGIGAGGGGGVFSEDMMIAPYISKSYSYHYDGTFDVSSVSSLVYRQVLGDISLSMVDTQIKNLSLGNFSFSNFDQAKVQNMTIVEDKDDGYSIQIDLTYGTIYLTKSWQRWEEPALYEAMTAEQMPENGEIISIAQDFLEDYQIDTSFYGEPIVQDEWRKYSEEDSYISEMVGVVYPRLIDGLEVWNLYGSPSGLYVYVNARTGTVESANWTLFNEFERSSYELVSGMEELAEVIEQGGLYQYQYEDAQELYDISLGEPRVVLAEYSQYIDGSYDTLYVPALSFAIQDVPEGADVYVNYVVVPLVKDILEQGRDDVYPVIMEVTEEAIEGEIDLPTIEPMIETME